jgi:hypothetical protein
MDDALALENGCHYLWCRWQYFCECGWPQEIYFCTGCRKLHHHGKKHWHLRVPCWETMQWRVAVLCKHTVPVRHKNRVTESHILNEAAKAFGMEKMASGCNEKRMSAIPSAAQRGDQITASLGVWAIRFDSGHQGLSIKPADDVHRSHLHIDNRDLEVGPRRDGYSSDQCQGFLAVITPRLPFLHPHVVARMLHKKTRLKIPGSVGQDQ